MAVDRDDEILQDFLVESGEILEQLNDQLLDLEQRPNDTELLNAVFRGFHTIKGGAGFLGIEPLVEVCHRAEDVFNILRQGERQTDAHLMDTMLQVLDVVNDMFGLIHNGEQPEPAAPELLFALDGLTKKKEKVTETETDAVDKAATVAAHENLEKAEVAIPLADDEITEEEFEALLDQLHGKGKHSGLTATGVEVKHGADAGLRADDDEITEEEFEALLDNLHGKGKFGLLHGTDNVKKTEAKVTVVEPAEISPKIEPKETSKTNPSTQPVTPKEKAETKEITLVDKATEREVKAEQAPKPSVETTVRVDTARLDEIMNMVGELVLVRNRLANLKSRLGDEEVANAVANLDLVTSDLQNSVMKTRMQPVKKVFGRFPRVVRDLARSMSKEIDLEMHGEETDLDKNLVEALADPMIHLVRNAVDHGIETPAEREKVGKPRKGKVILSAMQEGDHILLSIEDDGRGMDAEVLRRKAVEKGLMDQEAADRLDSKECYDLIFQPGFSTKTEISDVSGRGVGMDVVKTGIVKMNGSVSIDSELGKGSRIIIKLPLTLAILPTLMVVLGTQPFALPLTCVVEIFNLDLNRTNVVDGQLTIMVRERALPLFYLRNWLIAGSEESSQGHVVVANVGGRPVGLVVDYLIGQEEVVIKPLGKMLQGLAGMAGATITGDGKIALIIDVPGLIRKYVHRY